MPLDDTEKPPFDPTQPFRALSPVAEKPPFDPSKPFQAVGPASPQYTPDKPFVVDPKTTTPEAFDAWKEANPGGYAKLPNGKVFQNPLPTPEDVAKEETSAYDTSGMKAYAPPGWVGTAIEAGKKGIVQGFTESAQAPTAFRDRPPEAPDTSPVGQLLAAPLSQGWADPKWWIAHIVHGAAASSPSLATGAAGAMAGSAMAGPVGAIAGGAGGFGLGAAMQTIAPAYARARQEGLSHDDAVTRSLEQSGIAAAFGVAMGIAPIATPLKGAVSNALLQIFGAQPALGLGQLAATQATEGKTPSLDELGTAYAENAGMGAALVGAHAGARRMLHGKPVPETPPEAEPPAPDLLALPPPTPPDTLSGPGEPWINTGNGLMPGTPGFTTPRPGAPEPQDAAYWQWRQANQPPEPAPPPAAPPRAAARPPESIEQTDATLRAAVASGEPTGSAAVQERLAADQAEIQPDATSVPRGTVSGMSGPQWERQPDGSLRDAASGIEIRANPGGGFDIETNGPAGILYAPTEDAAIRQIESLHQRQAMQDAETPAPPPEVTAEAAASQRPLAANEEITPPQPAENPFPSFGLKELQDFAQRPGASQAVRDEIARRLAAGRPGQMPRAPEGGGPAAPQPPEPPAPAVRQPEPQAAPPAPTVLKTLDRSEARLAGYEAASKGEAGEMPPEYEHIADAWQEGVRAGSVARETRAATNRPPEAPSVSKLDTTPPRGAPEGSRVPVEGDYTITESRPEQERTTPTLLGDAFVPPTEARPEAPPVEAAPREHANAPTVSDETHTKTGKDIYAVRFPQKPDITGLGAQAKKLGGYWSSYKDNGARPGWLFKTRESADRFAEWARKEQEPLATAVFRDPYSGDVPVELVKRGDGYVWEAAVDRNTSVRAISAGYRPMPTADRAVNAARNDRRFTNVAPRSEEPPADPAAKPEAPLTPDEHPGLVIKSLETGKTTTIQPPGTRQPSQWNEVGKNSDGQTLYEDQRGVRSIVENGVRRTEPVGMRPTRSGTEITTDRISHPEYEIAAEQPAVGQPDLPTDDGVPTSTEAPRPETDNGVQNPLPAGDAGASAENDGAVAAPRPAGTAPPAEDLGGARDVRGPAEAAQGPEPGATAGGGGDRAVDADRVPAGARPGEPGAAGRPAETEGEVKAPPVKGRDLDLEEARALQDPTAAGREVDFVRGRNFTIEPGAADQNRSPRTKASDNLSAIELAKRITEEGRPATREEQTLLAKYVGWGGLSAAFPHPNTGMFRPEFEALGRRLREVLTPAEYRTAARSVQYAHYTSEPVIRAMWDAVERMGFKGGMVFEPGMGVGHFLGMMPQDLAAASKYQGVEMDHVTAQIAKLLYPQSGVRQADFTRTPMPRDTFDLAIGNPPFSDTPITSDPKYAAHRFLLHDYFFAKSLDSVRPGGLLAFVTSAGTMNKLTESARRFMAERAEFAGGVRLNSGAFAKNAGTEVTADILFFKKRPFGPVDLGDKLPDWTETVVRTLPNSDGKPMEGNVSRYFSEHPEMVLGEEGFFDKLYKDRYAVHPRPGEDMPTLLREALGRLPENIMEPAPTPQQKAALDFSTTEKKDGSYYTAPDGRLMQYSEGVGKPVERRGAGVEGGKTAAEMETIRSLLPIRDALRDVFRHDLAGDEPAAAKARQTLNKNYDAFVKKSGPLSKSEVSYRKPSIVQQETERNEARETARAMGEYWDEGSFDPSEMIAAGAKTDAIARARREARDAALAKGREWDEGSFDPADIPQTAVVKRPNLDAFADDQESFRLLALEDYDDKTGVATKRRLFRESILTREEEPKLNSANDGILWSVNKFGKLDIDKIAEQLGQPRDKVIADLGDQVMQVPGTDETFLPRDAYLSGDVVTKLEEARAAAERDKRFLKNVAALEEAQPPPLSPADIQINIGMPWIPRDTINEFVRDLGIGRVRIEHSQLQGKWHVDTRNAVYGDNTAQWSTGDKTAHEILSDILNRQPSVIKRHDRGPPSRTWVDEEATQAAQDKANAMKLAFQDWVASDPERADALAGIYNTRMNRVVLRQWNGDYLTTPGVSKDWTWRPHQTRVVARAVQDGNTYMAHAVGAGKTSAMIGIGMESRRLGLVNKPMYVVPNHMLGQFAKEFYEQYPTARIRVADDRNFHTSRRKRFVADVAQQDLDAIIITNSAFKKIPISREFGDRMIDEHIAEIDEALAQIPKGDRITRSKLEGAKEKLEQRLRSGGGDKDAVNTFEEMGVDFLFVDEAHQFRKLSFVTQTPMKGVDSQGSDMAWDLYTKVRYLDQNRPGRSLVMASGTPVTNTIGELYSLSRYMQPSALKERGLSHFDSWASAFGEIKTDLEPTPQGTYEPATRFSEFVNAPELYKMVGSVMDVVTEGDLGKFVTRPKVAGGERQLTLADRTPWMEAFQRDLKARADAIKARRGPPAKGQDIVLSLIHDGRSAAIDPRLVDPNLPNDPASKLNRMIDNVHRVWKETKDTQFYDPGTEYQKKAFKGPATQMVFANLGVGGGAGKFSAYQWMKREWVRRGIPANEISFIKDAKTPVEKQRLFNDMNEGKIRILVGSVAKMGTGVNAQRRLAAIHNLDPLWYPADDTQRNGRGIRQGNYNPEIQIHDYSTKGTYDEQMWKMMGRKGRSIEQFFRGDPNLRRIEDIGEAAVYDQISGMTAADPRVLQLVSKKQELQTIERRLQAHENEQYTYRSRARSEQQSAAYYQAQAAGAADAIARRQDIAGDKFAIEVAGQRYTDRKEAAEAIEPIAQAMVAGMQHNETRPFGSIGGFPLDITASQRVTVENGLRNVEMRPNFSLRLWESRDAPLSFGSGAGLIQSAAAHIRDLPETHAEYLRQQAGAEKRSESNRSQIGKAFPDRDKIQPMRQEISQLEAALTKKDEPPAPQPQPQPQQEARTGTPGERTELSPTGEMQSGSVFSRLMRSEEGSWWPLGRDYKPDASDQAEQSIFDQVKAAIPRGAQWSEKASLILGVAPNSPGIDRHNFNLINKNLTMPRTKAALDQRFNQAYSAVLAKYRDAAGLLHDYHEGLDSWQGKPREQWRKLFSAMEILTLEGREMPLDGRAIIVENRSHPYAGLSKPGDVIRLTSPEEIQMFTDYRNTMDRVWKDLVGETAKQFGWDGVPTSAAIRQAAEAAPDRATANHLMRAAKLVAAIEYQHRTAYLPLMREGDYFLRVKPTRPNEDWNGEGYAPTTMFKLINSEGGLERALGGMRGGIPEKAQQALDQLRQTFPAGDYTIDHGFMFRKADVVKDLDIPAIDKLMMLVGNDARTQLRQRLEATGMGRDEARQAAQKDYDQLVDTVLDQVFEQRVAGFKRQRQGIPGYDTDFARSTGRYMNWLANHTAGMKNRNALEAGEQAMAEHPDPRSQAFWRDFQRRQEDYGDQMYGPLAKLRQGAFLWYLGANAATTAKIMLHGPFRGVPMLTTGLGPQGMAKAAGDYLNASKQLLGALTVNKETGITVDFDRIRGRLSAPERALLDDSERKGIMHPQTADELAAVQRGGEDVLTDRGRFTKRVFDLWSSNVSAADRMVRGAMLLGAYRTANRAGMERINRVWDKDLNWKNAPAKTPQAFAQFMVDQTVGVWGDINRMPISRSQVGGMLTQFKTYEIGYFSNLNQMLRHMGPEGKVTGALMLGGMGMMGGVLGLPFANTVIDATDLIYKLIDRASPGLEVELKHALDYLLGEGGGENVLHGPARAMTGIDWSGIGFGDAISKNARSWFDLLGPGGAILPSSLVHAGQRYASGQGELAAARELLPNAVKHLLDAIYPEVSLTSVAGKTKALPESALSETDRVKMGLGFQPAKKAEAFERRSDAMHQVEAYKSAIGLAGDRIANLMARGQPIDQALVEASTLIMRGERSGVFSSQEAQIFRNDLRRKIQQRTHPEIPSKTQQRIEAAQRLQ